MSYKISIQLKIVTKEKKMMYGCKDHLAMPSWPMHHIKSLYWGKKQTPLTVGSHLRSNLRYAYRVVAGTVCNHLKEDEGRDIDLGAGESSKYYAESWWVIASRSIQRGWCWTQRWSNCIRFSNSLPIPGSIILLPSFCLPRHTPQSCTCYCSRCLSLGCCHFPCRHLLHLLTGSLFTSPFVFLMIAPLTVIWLVSTYLSFYSEIKDLIKEAKSVIKIPSFQIIFAQGVFGSFPWSGLSFATLWLELIGF